MSVTPSVGRVALAELQCVIEANPSVDWRAIALDAPGALDALEWHQLERDTIVPLLRAYQRLTRILPAGEERRAFPLLEHGHHSAIQIASLSKEDFARRWSALFPGENALGLAVHGAALSRRSALLPQYMDRLQRNEPHYRAARFR